MKKLILVMLIFLLFCSTSQAINEIIALRSVHSGKYVRAGIDAESHLGAMSSQVKAWETFKLINLGGNYVALQSAHSGKYVRAGMDAESRLGAVSPHIKTWETFRLIKVSDEDIALQSAQNGKYVRAGVGAKSQLAAISSKIGAWEKFKVVPAPPLPEIIALQSAENLAYVRGGINGESYLGAISPEIDDWEMFRLIELGGDKIALQSVESGKYVRAGMGNESYLAATSSQVAGWETFKLINLDCGMVALQSDLSGKYVRAGLGPESRMGAVSSQIKSWETFILRSGPPLPIPDLNESFHGVTPSPGKKHVLTILWDPHRPDHPAPTKNEIENMLFGNKASVRDYFLENSNDLFTIENAGVLGWYDADYDWQFYWREGSYNPENLNPGDPHYWKDGDGRIHYKDNENFIGGMVHKWAEAIKKADLHFNFKKYDRNNDGRLTTDELAIIIAAPQNGPFGTANYVVASQVPENKALFVDGVQLNKIVEIYLGSPPHIGLVAHELAHLLLGADDMYVNGSGYRPGVNSLMDSFNGGHLDPFIKLHLGWSAPHILTSSGKYKIKAVEKCNDVYILYNPLKGDGEYFIIENRWPGNSYDTKLVDQGLAIWHVIEDPKIYGTLSAPPGVDQNWWNTEVKAQNWGRRAVRLIKPGYTNNDYKALWDGSDPQTGYDLLSVDPDPNHATLKWADGTPSGFEIKNISASSPEMTVEIEVK